MDALAKLKQKHFAKISASVQPESQMSREAWEENLADVFAEAIVYLGQHGMSPLKDGAVPAAAGSSPRVKSLKQKTQKPV